MVTVDSVARWTALSFILWLGMVPLVDMVPLFRFDRFRSTGVAAAALLSWLMARLALSVLPPFVEWLHRSLRT